VPGWGSGSGQCGGLIQSLSTGESIQGPAGDGFSGTDNMRGSEYIVDVQRSGVMDGQNGTPE